MSLLDSSPEYFSTQFHQLPPPLIPVPVLGLEILEDIYSVGPFPTERWRSYIDIKDWDPTKYQDDMMRRRAYHARTTYEALFLISFTDSSWLSVPAYEMIKDIAHFELRCTEVEMLSWQLTCKMVGFKVENHEPLYRCAAIWYTTLMWITNKIVGPVKNRSEDQRKAYSEMVHIKPERSYGRKELAKYIDRYVFAIQQYLKKGLIRVDNEPRRNEILKNLSNQLQSCLILIDAVIVVTDRI